MASGSKVVGEADVLKRGRVFGCNSNASVCDKVTASRRDGWNGRDAASVRDRVCQRVGVNVESSFDRQSDVCCPILMAFNPLEAEVRGAKACDGRVKLFGNVPLGGKG